MKVLKEYKTIFLAGLAVVLFFGLAYFVMGNVESKQKFTYGEHLFQEGVVSEINIQIDEANWKELLENPLTEEYYRADVTINGELMGNTAIRTKGNTSLTSVANSDSDRYSFKLDFDYYDDNGNYYGLKKLCLNNNYADNSNMREYICYKIMEDMGLPVPQCGYSHITVNGEEWGLYLAVEAVDEVFLQTNFADATGDLYKPEGMGGTGADLVYRGDDITAYTNLNLKTNLETSDGSKIIALMKALETGEGLEEVLDIENALKYLAANVALANFDSYLGGTTHNYYLYEENGVFSMIPWDLNLSFGGFGGSKVDIYEPASSGMGGEMPAMGKMPDFGGEMPAMGEMPDFGGGMPAFGGSNGKPLVDTLLADAELLAMYEGYLQEMADTYLTEEYMTAKVAEIHDLIAPYVKEDATAFYTYEEFEQGCSVDPEDNYSLVYYAVNMAESIKTQLAGGMFKGGGMPPFGGREDADKKGAEMIPAMGEMPDFGGEMPAMGEMPDFGGEMPAMGEMPDFGGERPEKGNKGGMPFPGGERQNQADIKEVLPTMAICGGVFLSGLVFAVVYKRKNKMK